DPTEAGTVYGRGFFGRPEAGGLELDRTEAVYLTEMGRLEVTDPRGSIVPWTDVLRGAVRAEAGFPVAYLVYRDLRQRGYVVRASPPPARFAVLPRGGILNKTPARFWVQPISERAPFDLAAIRELFDRARGARKSLLLGVVDEESDLTYYRVTSAAPHGTRPFVRPEAPWTAEVTEDRVLLLDPAAVLALGGAQGFGSTIGSRLELSLVEAAFLAEQQAITLRSATTRRPVPLAGLRSRAGRVDPAFGLRLPAYRALRELGLIVKTGFKYGAHFRAYVRAPEHAHARYLIQAVAPTYLGPWPLLAGHVRLAQGVRKEFLLAAVDPAGPVSFLAFERIRP
ncbi:MAG: tRNA-intron lyase, partial [Thermoplasmata archaeon]